MGLLGRLSLGHKFTILGLIALLMVLVPTGLYVSKSLADIRTAEAESRGMHPLMAMQKVIQYAQQHRGLSAGMLSGNAAMKERRPAVKDNVDKAMAAVDAAMAEVQASAKLRQDWSALKQRWADVSQAVASGSFDTPKSTQAHTALIT